MWGIIFFLNSILLGVGLAMDAFSVSLTNGLNEQKMKFGRISFIAGCYAFFQFAMPMVGWVCVHTVVTYFTKFEMFIPWVALVLLLFIGGKMLLESIRDIIAEKRGETKEEEKVKTLSFGVLILQGIATSIDALSVGFTIADYGLVKALVCGLIIAIVTFGICVAGLLIGKKVGTKLGNKAGILGGIILIGIGIEIFVKGIFF